MNTLLNLLAANTDIWPSHAGGLKGILIGLLVMLIVLFVVAGLVWVIETYINKGPLPTPVRLVIALVMVILVIIWAFDFF
jgi:hypothetical protein